MTGEERSSDADQSHEAANECMQSQMTLPVSPASPAAAPPQQQQNKRPSPQNRTQKRQLPFTMQSPALMKLNDTKAGMKGLDTERINQIILNASKDSPFFKRQEDKQKVLDSQIADLLNRKDRLTKEQIRCAVAQMDLEASKLESQRKDLSRIIVHMDMDMFYAAVEMRDNPKLANVPLAVGSNSMLATSNYEARKFGVRAGMAGFIARKLCPTLVIKSPDMKKYGEVSNECMSLVAEYDPNYRSASVDEVYFDLTDYVLNKYNDSLAEEPLFQPLTRVSHPYPQSVWEMAARVVDEVRTRIKEKTRLTASAGIAHNKMIAKVCSDINKPDGQFLLPAHDLQSVEQFVTQMRVRKIGGIGPVQEQHLKALAIETCGDMFEKRGLIQLLFKPAHISFYLRVSIGVASNIVTEFDESERKSLGSENTFTATKDMVQLNTHLKELSFHVSERLKRKDLMGKTITLIIKWADFVLNDRSKSHHSFTSDESVIRETVESLLKQEMKKKDSAIRLLGVRVSNFGVNDVADPSDGPSTGPPAKKAKKTLKQKPITQFVARSPKKQVTSVATDATVRPFTLSSRLHPDHDFICIYCLRQFVDESSLEQHLDRKDCPSLLLPSPGPYHLPDGSINCPNCTSTFPNLTDLNSHLDHCLS